jgi:4-hydroxy-tetrahydrodipicolinate synthase
MKELYGVNPPVVTIFGKNGEVNLEACKKHADFLIEKGVDGLAYLGTSGEFVTMTLEERKAFVKEMVGYVDHRVNVIVGAGDTCLANTLEMLKFLEEVGADGVLLINPYFNVYEERMVEAYYDKVADATNLPVIIYNFPSLTGFRFERAMVTRLALRHKNIVGIKETVDDPEHLRDMLKIKEARADFKVFCAYESQALSMMLQGVDGFINSTANFAPEYTVGVYRNVKEGNIEEAAISFFKMNEAMDVYQCSTPLLLAVKQAVIYRVGIKEEDTGERLPGLPLLPEEKQKVHDLLKKWKLL